MTLYIVPVLKQKINQTKSDTFPLKKTSCLEQNSRRTFSSIQESKNLVEMHQGNEIVGFVKKSV